MSVADARQLTVSIVTFHPDEEQFKATLDAFVVASREVDAWNVRLFVIDNTPSPVGFWQGGVPPLSLQMEIIAGHGNVGFGQGHNLVLDRLGEYHLILNPDVELAADALAAGLAFMDSHPECGLLTPFACWENRRRQYLCKRPPAVFDLLLRGFAPDFMKRWFRGRLAKYEMQDVLADAVYWDPPIVSGCFMLFRRDVLRSLRGFDPRYFLYFEDFDLSLRVGEVSRIAYVPTVRIVHHGGNAARKGWVHIRMLGRSALTFFSIHGWRFW